MFWPFLCLIKDMKTYKKDAFNTFNMGENVHYTYSGLQLQMSAGLSWVLLYIFFDENSHM